MIARASEHKTYVWDRGDGEEEIAISVFYRYSKGCRGKTDGPGGLPLEPDDPAHVEIEYAIDGTGETVELTNKEENRIIEDICNKIWDDTHSDPDDCP
jgi:hypothetical protein